MGFFDKFLKALGFENEDAEDVDAKKTKNADLTNPQFDLSKVETEEKEELEVKVFTPTTQEEIQECLIKIENLNEAYINLENFNREDEVRALDFISGALFVLKKTIKRVDANLFIIKPLGE